MRLPIRFTALSLCLALMCSAFPLTAAALTDDDFSYELSDDGTTAAITGYTGSDTEIVIPNMIDGVTVTAIADRAFEAKRSIVSVQLPDSLLTIGNSAFAACTALTGVDIPDSVVTVGPMAFYNCFNLDTITIGTGTYDIGYQAFHNTYWLNHQDDGPVYIGRVLYTYMGVMPENTEITIRTGTAAIAPYAFSGRTTLKAVYIPVGLRVIGDFAFMNCSSLLTVRVPSSVSAIGSKVFLNADVATILGVSYSTAYTYATDNTIHFEYDASLDYPDGDMNKDGLVNTSDFRIVMRWLVDDQITHDAERLASCDAVYDGVITSSDVRALMLISLGL